MEKAEIKEKEAKLLEMVGAFCAQKLNDDYFLLCEKLIKKIGRKREVPFQRGKLDIWAAAVVYTIGSINFLFDKSFEPYLSAKDISDYFGTSNSTVSAKARDIRNSLKLSMFDSEFSTSKMKEINPFNQFVMVDGFIAPLSSLPENLQEKVREARENGEDIQFFTK